jgi:hypothetical protein
MSKNFEIIYKEFMDSKTFVLSRELLEDYKRQAAQAEQDRIVKLLEFELWETFQKSHNERPAWATMKLLITAIKGENE